MTRNRLDEILSRQTSSSVQDILFALLMVFVVAVQGLALADSREVFRTAPEPSGTQAILRSLNRDLLPMHCIAPVIPASASTGQRPLAPASASTGQRSRAC